MHPQPLPLSRVYQLIEPGPVVLVATAEKGRKNVMTMAWLTPLEFEPPLIGCVVSENNYSFRALTKTKQCVIAVPTVEMAETVVKIGNASGADTDKFATFGLHALPAKTVDAPLMAECYANLECKVVDTAFVKKYNFFVLEVTKAWIDPKRKHPRTIHHRGKDEFVVDGRTIRVPSRMK